MSSFTDQGHYNFHQQKHTFGSGGIVLRARDREPLTLPQIQHAVPSIFAEHKHDSRSDRYAFIPTYEILEAMIREGFFPMEVRQGGSRDVDKRGFTKHLIRFRRNDSIPALGETYPETCLVNSHDGTSTYQFFSAWWRRVCDNGLIVSEGTGPSIAVAHRGSADDVIEASYRIVDNFEQQQAQIEDMSATRLSLPEQEAFATAAIQLRFNEQQIISVPELLRPKRQADVENTTWNTLNRIQERLVTGGLHVAKRNAQGQLNIRRSRSVNGITDNVNLNRALWTLAEEMNKLKKAA